MDKSALRKEFLAKRKALLDELKNKYSKQICGHIMNMPQFERAKTVAAYSAIGSEVDLSPVVFESGKEIALPVCVEGDTLVFKKVGDKTTLEKGTFGIAEPKETQPEILPEEIDLILVPGAVFDKSGGRIGYGKGYYDRILPHLSKECTIIGVAYSIQIADGIETEPHDIKVSLIVTEEGIHECINGASI
ncbi:MAG: 5-formyltetrahydrofolate cyclo-ligase [Clostridia bacterium]|nr:5-formyltetrahydrofolate cyclo-ligase [Clostridia bacterium]MBR2974021.1 5-formyltetrahydrofolate cyclo-ligase [Clostridia bacterium]